MLDHVIARSFLTIVFLSLQLSEVLLLIHLSCRVFSLIFYLDMVLGDIFSESTHSLKYCLFVFSPWQINDILKEYWILTLQCFYLSGLHSITFSVDKSKTRNHTFVNYIIDMKTTGYICKNFFFVGLFMN